MSNFASNYSMADVLRHVDIALAEDYDTKIYVSDDRCIVLENKEWKFHFEGDGIIRVSNENYPEIEIVCSDKGCCKEDYYDFLNVCKERFLKEAEETKIDKIVAEMIFAEERAYLQMFAKGEISSAEKDRKLLAIYHPQHHVSLRKAIMKTIENTK